MSDRAARLAALRQSRLVPVAARNIWGDPDGVHLSVYRWVPRLDAWATGSALCGKSADQGALPDDTPVACATCESYREDYERALAAQPVTEEGRIAALTAERDAARAETERLRQQLAAAEAKVRAVGMVRCWRNEDGKRFVFADDLLAALDPAAWPAAAPAEPACRCYPDPRDHEDDCPQTNTTPTAEETACDQADAERPRITVAEYRAIDVDRVPASVCVACWAFRHLRGVQRVPHTVCERELDALAAQPCTTPTAEEA